MLGKPKAKKPPRVVVTADEIFVIDEAVRRGTCFTSKMDADEILLEFQGDRNKKSSSKMKKVKKADATVGGALATTTSTVTTTNLGAHKKEAAKAEKMQFGKTTMMTKQTGQQTNNEKPKLSHTMAPYGTDKNLIPRTESAKINMRIKEAKKTKIANNIYNDLLE